MKPRMCLYCPSPPETGHRSHAMSQALVQNPLVLPPGFICLSCESYLGTHLDAALTHHPSVHHRIQALGLPGREGRARVELGGVTREADGAWMSLPVEPGGKIRSRDKSGTGLSIRLLAGPGYDDRLISRALHMFAFNLEVLAKVESEGNEAARAYALSEAFDEVARYVRRPHHRGEFWAFAEKTLPARSSKVRIGASAYQCRSGRLVLIEVLDVLWGVTLDGGNMLEHLVGEARAREPRMSRARIVTEPRKVERARTRGDRYVLHVQLNRPSTPPR